MKNEKIIIKTNNFIINLYDTNAQKIALVRMEKTETRIPSKNSNAEKMR